MNPILLTHIISGSLVLILGSLILISKNLNKISKVYLIASFFSAVSGLIVSFNSTRGKIVSIGFFILSLIWLFFLYRLSKEEKVSRKSRWFIFSYSLAFLFITLRIIKYSLIFFFGLEENLSHEIGLVVGAIINLVIALLITCKK